MTPLTSRLGAGAAALTLCVSLSACQGNGANNSRTAPPTDGPAATTGSSSGSALALVRSLTVKGRGPKTGYARDKFGPAWADTNRNGCSTRDDILNRDLTAKAFRTGTHECVVLSGRLAEPYTGRIVTFSKSHASDVQIDHVVALSDAWQKGAAGWPYAKRLGFANDTLNLLAVDGPANMAKGDSDTASWLPANKAYRCTYVARQVAVKYKFKVNVTSAERDAMVRVLSTCPTLLPPSGGNPVLAPVGLSDYRSSGSTGSAAPAAHPAADPDYGTCANAKAHGAGPYHRGEPEFAYYRDADGDGVVCEP